MISSDVSRELRRLFGDVRGCQWTLDETATANATPWSAQWEEVLGAALADIGEPGAVLLPTLCTGFTDARLVRPLGTPVLGFAPLPRDTDLDRCGCHNLDEEFPVAGLLFRVKFLLALAWRWCGGEGVSAR